MVFSKACEYGIRAIIYIAQQSQHGERVSLKSIAKEIDSPVAFTAKILQQLARNNVVESQKGPSGGFYIPKSKLESLRLIQVVSAIDGDEIFKGCGLGLKECSEVYPCPVHHQFKFIRDELEKMLKNTKMVSLVNGLETGLTFLKR